MCLNKSQKRNLKLSLKKRREGLVYIELSQIVKKMKERETQYEREMIWPIEISTRKPARMDPAATCLQRLSASWKKASAELSAKLLAKTTGAGHAVPLWKPAAGYYGKRLAATFQLFSWLAMYRLLAAGLAASFFEAESLTSPVASYNGGCATGSLAKLTW